MHVLVTSAHGWVGQYLTPLLLAKGYTVTGLARSSSSADKIKALGATPVSISLDDPKAIAEFIRTSNVDAVIHTAFNHDFSKYIESVAMDLAVIQAIGGALEGTNKPFLVTFGASAAVETEVPSPASPNPRGKNEAAVLDLAGKGVKAMVIRLAASVHGKGSYAFVPTLINYAREKKVVAYVEGAGVWSAVHVKDAAELYMAALERGQAGARYHGAAESGVKVKDIAAVVGEELGVEVKAIKAEEAGEYVGFIAPFLAADLRLESDITKKELGWVPKEPGLLADIEDKESGYFEEKKLGVIGV